MKVESFKIVFIALALNAFLPQAGRFGQQSIFDFSSYEYSVALPPKQVLGKILTFPAKVGWLEP